MKAVVFDIKRFAVHDGPGIRTTLFLKGCPLDCKWCHNPEGLERDIQLWYFHSQCLGCADCVSSCPRGALALANQEIRIDRSSCTNCGKCVGICPTGALHFIGETMSLEKMEGELLRDRIFYEESGGGITLSGGEPLSHPELTRELLERMKAAGIHTAVETSLFCSRDNLGKIAPLCDYFLTDIKIMDSQTHKKHTAQGNGLILENISYLASNRQDMLIRVPLIPGFTDDQDNLEGIAGFVASLPGEIPVELMNFNPLARDKFRILGRPYAPEGVDQPYTDQEMEKFRDIFRHRGLKVL